MRGTTVHEQENNALGTGLEVRLSGRQGMGRCCRGRQPLFLNLGGGLEVANGITTGASAHVSLSSEATLIASSDLSGTTQYEELTVTAKPVIRPVLSMNLEWEHLCRTMVMLYY